jgi:hypothetical protein
LSYSANDYIEGKVNKKTNLKFLKILKRDYQDYLAWVRSNDIGTWLSMESFKSIIENQLVELYLLCHREPIYKV